MAECELMFVRRLKIELLKNERQDVRSRIESSWRSKRVYDTDENKCIGHHWIVKYIYNGCDRWLLIFEKNSYNCWKESIIWMTSRFRKYRVIYRGVVIRSDSEEHVPLLAQQDYVTDNSKNIKKKKRYISRLCQRENDSGKSCSN